MAMAQEFYRGMTGFLAQEELELRSLGAQAGEEAREQERGDGRDDAHAQVSAKRLAGRLGDGGQFLSLAQHPVRLFHDTVAERGEADNPAGALDQGHADQRFQLPDAGRKCGLGHETCLRRPSEMSLLLQRHQILKLFQRWHVAGH